LKIHTTSKYYYQIIPLVRLPLTKDNDFTYHFDRQIKFGSLVKIKLNNKIVRGISVGRFRNTTSALKPNFKTSPILKIITSAQITKEQLKLAKLISAYYLTPLSTTLKFFAFKLTKKNNPDYFQDLNKQISEINEQKWQEEIILTASQEKAIKQITSKNITTNEAEKPSSLLFGPPASGKTEIIIESIKHTIQDNKQALVLIPEIFLSYQEILRYSNKFYSLRQNKNAPAKIAILHSQLKPSEITTIWNGVKSGEIKIVISTRMGVFLPFKNLGLIIVDEEQDISHKQWDTPPFYHTRQVATLLQKVYTSKSIRLSGPTSGDPVVGPLETKVLLVSSTPSLNSYRKAIKSKNWQLIKLPSLKTKVITVKKPTIELVDLKKYYKKGQQIFVSNELRFSLKNVLYKNKIAMLLVPRRGKSSTIICQDCQEVPICPDCQVPLVHSENSYRCFHCNFKISNISKCPHCGSFRLSDLGFGTESVKDAIQTTFPSARIAIADSLTFKDNSYRQKVLSDLYNNKLDFLVGTYTIAKGLDIKDVDLVTIINADNWPGQTDFRFDENYLSTIFQLAGRVNRPGGNQAGKCLIQTFDPVNRIFTYLKNWNWQEFVEYELENRQILNYPPFKHLIKITYRNYNKKIVEKELDKLYTKLSSLNHKLSILNFQLTPPYFGHQEQLRGQWHKHLLLKIKRIPITDKKLLKILDLSTGWKIDVDTENVF
jgi:primosomal protein N' (replication factor Y)